MPNFLLSLLVFLPIFASIIVLFISTGNPKVYHRINIGFSLLSFLIVLFLSFFLYPYFIGLEEYGELVLIQKFEWFRFSAGPYGEVAVDYFLGLDGMNFPLLGLSTLILLIASVFSREIDKKVQGYTALFQLISGAIIGSFLALDFFLFYLFFELMLLPMFFLIGIWGGPRKEYASIKFFLYTLFGSLLILAVMIILNISYLDPLKSAADSLSFTNSKIVHGFSFFNLSDQNNILIGSPLGESESLLFGLDLRTLAFWSLLIGFMIKLPSVPFHTWLPDAHVEAPTPVSIILAALLLKIGAYGIFRIAAPIFPDILEMSSEILCVVSIISIIYGGLNALAMTDLKKMIAYSSVSHMGFVLLGLSAFNSEGFVGANIQMISHGLHSAGLFILAGVIYRRTGSREIEDYSGLNHVMPIYATMTLLVFLASMGLPGFSGFIGEILILIGAFNAAAMGDYSIWLVALGVLGIFISAVYFIWTMQRMFFGSLMLKELSWKSLVNDLEPYEKYSLMTLILFSAFIGLFPFFITDMLDINISSMVEIMNQHLD